MSDEQARRTDVSAAETTAVVDDAAPGETTVAVPPAPRPSPSGPFPRPVPSGAFARPTPSGRFVAPEGAWRHGDGATTLPPILSTVLRRAAESSQAEVAPPRPHRRRFVIGLGGASIVLMAAIVGVVIATRGPAQVPPAPTTRTATVHDTGSTGVTLRAQPRIASAAQGTAPDGTRIEIDCAQQGQSVADVRNGVAQSSDVWLHTLDGRYLSTLYADLGRPPAVRSCAPDGRLLGTQPAPAASSPETPAGSGSMGPDYCVDGVCVKYGGN